MGVADIGREQFVLEQAGAIHDRHDGELVGVMRTGHFLDDDGREGRAFDQHVAHLLVIGFLLRVERHRIGRFVRHDDKQRRIDDVRAFAQDLALRAFLAARRQEGTGVAEIVDARIVGQRLAGRQVAAVAGKHIGDLALSDRDHRVDVDAVLERREKVEAAAAQVRLQARFAGKGQQAGVHGARRAPQFFDDTDAVIRDVFDDAGELEEQCNDEQEDHCADDDGCKIAAGKQA